MFVACGHTAAGLRAHGGRLAATSPTTAELRTAELARKTNWAFLGENLSRA